MTLNESLRASGSQRLGWSSAAGASRTLQQNVWLGLQPTWYSMPSKFSQPDMKHLLCCLSPVLLPHMLLFLPSYPTQTQELLYGQATSGMFGYSHLTGGYQGGQAEFVRVPLGKAVSACWVICIGKMVLAQPIGGVQVCNAGFGRRLLMDMCQQLMPAMQTWMPSIG